jgi:hypothetical protein
MGAVRRLRPTQMLPPHVPYPGWQFGGMFSHPTEGYPPGYGQFPGYPSSFMPQGDEEDMYEETEYVTSLHSHDAVAVFAFAEEHGDFVFIYDTIGVFAFVEKHSDFAFTWYLFYGKSH